MLPPKIVPNLPAHATAPGKKYIRDCCWILGWTWNHHSDISPTPPLNFYRGWKMWENLLKQWTVWYRSNLVHSVITWLQSSYCQIIAAFTISVTLNLMAISEWDRKPGNSSLCTCTVQNWPKQPRTTGTSGGLQATYLVYNKQHILGHLCAFYACSFLLHKEKFAPAWHTPTTFLL